MSSQSLTIGFLAREADVNIETIRYYQRVGLIREPAKPAKGYRRYPVDTIERIKFIKRAQKLGFSLAEISELLMLGDGRCKDVRLRAELKRNMIAQQIEDLTKMQLTLEKLIKTCGKTDNNCCPIVKSLFDSES